MSNTKSYSNSYKEAGVDVTAGYRSVELIKKHVARTNIPGVVSSIGGFGGLFEPNFSGMKTPTLVSGTDGVGTKLKIAFLMDKHDTVGIDCVAMCANDVACSGAQPLFFLDYLAVGKNIPEKVADIVGGVAEGCVQAGCALIGGETAEMPGFYPPEEYDLAGFCVGLADKEKIVDCANVKVGDTLIGVASTGLHSNGFSLVRTTLRVSSQNISKYMLAAVAALTVLAGCTKNFEELAKNVYGVSDEQMAQDGLALGGMLQQLERSVIIYRDGTWLDSDYQIMYNLCAETWCGYMAPTLSDGHNAGWDVNDGWHRRMFTVKYQYAMGGYTNFETAALEYGMENELALAKVLKVASMHQVADYYGPIAYAHTGDLSNLYDPLDQVYVQFFDELDESIEILEKVAASGAKLLEDYDLVYGGDAAKWVRFANSLRLRLAMRVSYADPTLAREEAEKSIGHPGGRFPGFLPERLQRSPHVPVCQTRR